MRVIVGVVIFGVLVGGLYFLNRFTRDDKGRSLLNVAGEPPVAVQVTKPVQRDIVKTVQAPGEVEAFLEVDISAEVVAKIVEMPVEEGDVVKQGQVLCRLDDADYQARVRSAEANVEKLHAAILQAEADFEKADRDLKHQIKLLESDATSALELADYRTAQTRARMALAIRNHELVEAESLLASPREDLDKTVIESPIDGIISQRFAKAGEVVVMGTMNNAGTIIMVISDLSKMQVRCRVDEADIVDVKPDQPAKIFLQSDLYTGVPGHVHRVASKGTRVTGRDVVTFETLVLVDSPDDKVKPGMNASVEIEVQRREGALTIPVQAVVTRKRKDLPGKLVSDYDASRAGAVLASEKRRQSEYIMVVFCRRKDQALARLVQTGVADETSVEIMSGLAADDLVITGPFRSLDQLKHEAPVKDEDVKSDTPAEVKSDAAASDDAVLAGKGAANGNANDNIAASEGQAQAPPPDDHVEGSTQAPPANPSPAASEREKVASSKDGGGSR